MLLGNVSRRGIPIRQGGIGKPHKALICSTFYFFSFSSSTRNIRCHRFCRDLSQHSTSFQTQKDIPTRHYRSDGHAYRSFFDWGFGGIELGWFIWRLL